MNDLQAPDPYTAPFPRAMLNKVPQVTLLFWAVKTMSTTVGETAADFLSVNLNRGYATSALIYGTLIAAVALCYYGFKLNAVLAFWLAYILTRPLSASVGDYLSQPLANGGLGLGTVVTSIAFLGAILAGVIYVTVTRFDALDARLEASRGR